LAPLVPINKSWIVEVKRREVNGHAQEIVRAAGKRAALIHARDTVLRGVTNQPTGRAAKIG
jgi:hypothetical protein